MIMTGITDADYSALRRLLRAEREIIKRRVERLIKNECGVGFSLVSGCSLTKGADNVAAHNTKTTGAS